MGWRILRLVGGSRCGFGCGGCKVFHVSHNLGESFVRSGEDGGEGAELCAGFQAAPLEVFQFAIACCLFDVAEAELLPDGGGGVGEDGIEEGGDDADGFGGGVENFCTDAPFLAYPLV